MLYKVKVKAPAIDDEITVNADNGAEAEERAVTTAIQRQMASNNATVEIEPQTGEPPPPAEPEPPPPPPEKPEEPEPEPATASRRR